MHLLVIEIPCGVVCVVCGVCGVVWRVVWCVVRCVVWCVTSLPGPTTVFLAPVLVPVRVSVCGLCSGET